MAKKDPHTKTKNTPKIGFIGQGWIGKNYSDDFEDRGYEVVRYALEEPYKKNKDKIKTCDIVFMAVPTPTTPDGFDDSIVRAGVKLVGKGKTVVIKSTIVPGTTESIQAENPDIFVMHSPEFLTEATAKHDAANPIRNIIGVAVDSKEYRAKAKEVMEVLPVADYSLICKAKEAEFIKYGGNNWFYLKIIFVNLLYDLAGSLGCDYDVIREAMAHDPRIGKSHLMPVHKSGTLGSDNFELIKDKQPCGGRGAGGHCFIKDFATFSRMYADAVDDELGRKVLETIEEKNIDLLRASDKDLDLLIGVYGEEIIN